MTIPRNGHNCVRLMAERCLSEYTTSDIPEGSPPGMSLGCRQVGVLGMLVEAPTCRGIRGVAFSSRSKTRGATGHLGVRITFPAPTCLLGGTSLHTAPDTPTTKDNFRISGRAPHGVGAWQGVARAAQSALTHHACQGARRIAKRSPLIHASVLGRSRAHGKSPAAVDQPLHAVHWFPTARPWAVVVHHNGFRSHRASGSMRGGVGPQARCTPRAVRLPVASRPDRARAADCECRAGPRWASGPIRLPRPMPR